MRDFFKKNLINKKAAKVLQRIRMPGYQSYKLHSNIIMPVKYRGEAISTFLEWQRTEIEAKYLTHSLEEKMGMNANCQTAESGLHS